MLYRSTAQRNINTSYTVTPTLHTRTGTSRWAGSATARSIGRRPAVIILSVIASRTCFRSRPSIAVPGAHAVAAPAPAFPCETLDARSTRRPLPALDRVAYRPGTQLPYLTKHGNRHRLRGIRVGSRHTLAAARGRSPPPPPLPTRSRVISLGRPRRTVVR